MQTFLPYDNFKTTAMVLDDKRLGKQRVEAMQILNILCGRTKTNGWRNHPAVTMWSEFENALKLYYNIILQEWESRGFVNNMPREVIDGDIEFPPFIGDHAFHMCHRSNLLRKDPEHYGIYNWGVPDYLPYIWGDEIAISR